MKLAQLETFIAVAEELHFRRAAERLHLQPSAVSTAIQQLEHEYGLPLFIRNSRNVQLTPAGEVLLSKSREALRSIDELEATARALAEPDRFTLNVGFLDEGLAELNEVVHSSYLSRYSNARVPMSAIDYHEFGDSLRSERIDVAITSFPAAWFDMKQAISTPLFAEPRVAVLPRDHPLTSRPAIEVGELLDQPFLRFIGGPEPMHQAFMFTDRRDPAISPDVPVEVSHMQNGLNHVSSGSGIFSVSSSTERFFSRPDIVFVPIEDLDPVTIYVTRRADDTRPHVLAYIDECINAVNTSLDLIPTATNATPQDMR